MTTVVNVPPSLDDHSFDDVLRQLTGTPSDSKVLLDARHVRWASPFGLTALLTLAQTRAEMPALAVPELEETASYWARAGFFRHAEELYELHGSYPKRAGASDSNVLLEITSVAKSEDVHDVVGRIQQKAQLMLRELSLDAKATVGFAMTLSEICQNIVARRARWVGDGADLPLDQASRPTRRRDCRRGRGRWISPVARDRAGKGAWRPMG